MKNFKTQKGITLIALVITIIVMMILVAVSVTVALRGGLFRTAKQAADDTKEAKRIEQKLDDGKIKVNGEWYNSVNDYLNKNPITTGIELSTPKIELKKKQSEEVTGEQKLEETITASVFGMDKEPEITWEFSPTDQTAIELSATTGKTITVTAKGTEDAEVTLTAKCTYEGEVKTATLPVTLEILKPKPLAKGTNIEYGVAYTGMDNSTQYTTTNGWRLLDYTYDENTKVYSDVKLISTGSPITIIMSDSWTSIYPVDDTQLDDFYEIIGGAFLESSYSNITNDTYIKRSASLYYNFGNIKYADLEYGEEWVRLNMDCFHCDSISTAETTTDNPVTINSLFKVRNDVTVRAITLSEINRYLGRSTGSDSNSVDVTTITTEEDPVGLLLGSETVVATPARSENSSYLSFRPAMLSSNGSFGEPANSYDGVHTFYQYKARPVICISSNIQFADSDGDGTFEMTVVQ